MVTKLTVVIILKCIEILNHYVVKEELTVLQVNYTSKINKLIEKEIIFMVIRGRG